MSAFIVEDKTINKIVCWLDIDRNRNGRWYWQKIAEAIEVPEHDEEFPDKLGLSMSLLNVDAVNQRYSESTQAEGYQFHFEQCSDMEAYKSLCCWLYQCAEGTCPETALYKIMERAKGHIANEIISKLPAYEMAEWR